MKNDVWRRTRSLNDSYNSEWEVRNIWNTRVKHREEHEEHENSKTELNLEEEENHNRERRGDKSGEGVPID